LGIPRASLENPLSAIGRNIGGQLFSVLQTEDWQFGLVVDDIQDMQEIVVKPLGKQLKGLSCHAGSASAS